ncbi:hypothetical protein GGR55DRAFT_700119 [Xylaria sp. FL0064]|nr:hypothetical protein GGR55DRAFT_700119 [Xylaria sp. FL0064]
MRLSLFFIAVYLAVLVSGKGARVAYEKIFLFYAYEIDQLNPEDKQSIGYKCTDPIDKQKGGCRDPAPGMTGDSPKPRPRYQRCMNVTERPCKSLREFLSHIDDKDWNKITAIPGANQDTPTPDVEGTKNIMMEKDMDKNRYAAWRVIKDGTSFNGMIDSVGDVLKNTWNSLSDADRATHKVLFDRAGEALDGVKWSRHIDHSKYVVDHLAADKPEIKVVAPEAGKDWKGNSLYDFQLLATIKQNEEKLPDVRDKLEASLEAWYNDEGNKKPRDHRIVGVSCGTI